MTPAARRPTPAEVADALAVALLLTLEPVGVRVFGEADAFERWPAPRPDAPVHYCSAVMRAAAGASVKLARADIACDTAPRTLGLEPGFAEDGFVESYVTGGLYRDRPTADAVLAEVATLAHSAGIGLGPLATFTPEEPPDVVIVAVTPYGAMRVTQAAAFTGLLVRAAATGMHGVCSECTAAPLATGRVSVSLLCSGARHAAGFHEHVMALGVPMALAGEVAAGLAATAERYESDDRKPRLRAACRDRLSDSDELASGLASLREGTGYFAGT